MSLDPPQHSTHEQQRIDNFVPLQSPPGSVQYDDVSTNAAHGASDPLIEAADTHQQLPRDKGKRRDSDLDTDTHCSTVVRVTDPQLVQNNSLDNHTNADASSDQAAAVTDVAQLAPELLMRIFAFLDPVSLSRAAAVCRSWTSIARDDATWRAAFATYFSLEAAQAHRTASLEVSVTPALRRLTNASWRHEFQQRVDLLRQWRKSRTPTVLSTPRVDLIKQISLSKQHRLLLSATDTYGVASRSNPWTGKVIKGYLDAEGTANGAGNGNPNVEFSPNVTTLNMSSDASHIFWGFRSGEVGMTIMSRQGTNARGAIRSLRFTPRASHSGPVTAIAVPFASDSDGAHGPGRSPERLRQSIATLGDVASTFVTAGFDGTVRMWTYNRSWPLWIASCSTKTPVSNAISSATPAQANPDAATPICALAYDARNGILAAGSTDGKIFVWSNIDVAALLRIPPEATDPDHLRNGDPTPETLEAQADFLRLSKSIRATTIELPPGPVAEVAVSSLHIDVASSASGKGHDAGANAEDCCILAHHSGARVLLRHRLLQDPSVPVETTVMGAAVMDEITSIRPDFEPRLPKRDARSSAAQSPSTSVYASPTLSATRPELGGPGGNTLTQPPSTLVLGPSPFDSYDGSGQYPERKFVCVGTKGGSLFLFDWESAGAAFDETTQLEWQGHSPPRFRGEKQLLPSIGWEAHHTSITALELTPLHIFVGTSDGTIKVYDSLAGDLIRTINDRTATRHPARMLAAGELTETEAARFRVTQIIADNECLVASIGHQILAFKADPVLSKRAAAAAAAASAASSAKSKGARPRLSDNKYAMQVELKRDLRDSQAELEAENEERQAEYSKIRNRQGFELEGLSEQEALEYALMLSRDQEAATAVTKAQHMGGSGYVPGSHASSSRKKISVPEQVVDDPELADALEQIALAESKAEADRAFYHPEAPVSFYDRPRHTSRRSSSSTSSKTTGRYRMLEDQDFGSDLEDDGDLELEPYLRPSPSPSPSASPYLSGLSSPPASRAWTILSQAGSSATTPAHASDRWGKMSKVRTVNVPRSARLSSPTPAESASISSSLGSHSIRSGGGTLSPPELSSPRDFPAMSSVGASPRGGGEGLLGAATGGGSPFFRRASSSFANSPGAASPIGLGKWNKSPNLRPVAAPLPSPSPQVGAQAQHRPSAWTSRRPSAIDGTATTTTTSSGGGQPSLLAASLRSTDVDHKHKGKAKQEPPQSHRQRQQQEQEQPEEADDDLTFAIQLSLAEQRSRFEL